MFNIGFTELVILGIIALLVIGPEQLPEMAKKLAKLLNELKRAKDEIMSPVEDLRTQAQQALEQTRRKMDEQLQQEVASIVNQVKKLDETTDTTKDKKELKDG